MATQHSVFKVGKSTVLVPDDQFADGYANGLLAYPQDLGLLLTVTALRQIIAESLFDVQHPDEWNTGYIVGAISCLRQGDRRDEPDGKEVALGSVTLRFNNWRFREGYSNGKLDYEQGQQERTSQAHLSARDLLCSIAYYDPETDRYHFGEEELACLEETLGQLVGYLCTDLFPEREPSTGPVARQATFQEA